MCRQIFKMRHIHLLKIEPNKYSTTIRLVFSVNYKIIRISPSIVYVLCYFLQACWYILYWIGGSIPSALILSVHWMSITLIKFWPLSVIQFLVFIVLLIICNVQNGLCFSFSCTDFVSIILLINWIILTSYFVM
jgi:hypothetical protein